MRWTLRIVVLLFVSGTLAVAGPPTSQSSAQVTPSLTVTPNVGLVGGDTVTVAGSGFSPSSPVGFCEARIDSSLSPADCPGAVFAVADTDAAGAFSRDLSLARFITPLFPKETID